MYKLLLLILLCHVTTNRSMHQIHDLIHDVV